MEETTKYEALLREKRTNRATEQKLMGEDGKLAVILQAFGTPIVRHRSSIDMFYDDDDVPTEYATTASGQIGPVAYREEILEDDDYTASEEGLLFDGLSRGCQIEITFWTQEDELRVVFKGHTVYQEISGQLYAYVPDPQWEDFVHRMFPHAEKRLKELQGEYRRYMNKVVDRNKIAYIRELISRWGNF